MYKSSAFFTARIHSYCILASNAAVCHVVRTFHNFEQIRAQIFLKHQNTAKVWISTAVQWENFCNCSVYVEKGFVVYCTILLGGVNGRPALNFSEMAIEDSWQSWRWIRSTLNDCLASELMRKPSANVKMRKIKNLLQLVRA